MVVPELPKEILIEIIKLALPDVIEILSENPSGRFETYWQQAWIPELRLVSREFSTLVTDEIVRASHCYVNETRRAEDIAIGTASLPGTTTLRIDMFPDFILQGCMRLIIMQDRTDALLPSDMFDVSAFSSLKSVGLDTNATTMMLGSFHWLSCKLARPAEEEAVQPILPAFRNLLIGRPSLQIQTVNYDYTSHTFYCVVANHAQSYVYLDSTVDKLCYKDDDFAHDLIKTLASNVLGISRATIHGLNDNALFSTQFWTLSGGEHVKLGNMVFGQTPEENFVVVSPLPPKPARKKGWEVVAEDDAQSGAI